jgi:hypothetical protein
VLKRLTIRPEVDGSTIYVVLPVQVDVPPRAGDVRQVERPCACVPRLYRTSVDRQRGVVGESFPHSRARLIRRLSKINVIGNQNIIKMYISLCELLKNVINTVYTCVDH